MLYLLFALLLFGLIQSLLELKKDSKKKSKWRVEKILSFVYICCFIIGLAITVLQEKESAKSSKLMSYISSSVQKIDFASSKQIDASMKSLSETKSLISRADSMNRGITDLIATRNALILETKRINVQLSKQLEMDKSTIRERQSSVALMDYDLKWVGTDSTSYSIEACVRNFGKRNAIITGGGGYVIFFDNQKHLTVNLKIAGNHVRGILQPNEQQGMRICYYSYGVKEFEILKQQTYFAVVSLKIKFKDELDMVEREEVFYSGWFPAQQLFGGLKDWQVQLAKQWELTQ